MHKNTDFAGILDNENTSGLTKWGNCIKHLFKNMRVFQEPKFSFSVKRIDYYTEASWDAFPRWPA